MRRLLRAAVVAAVLAGAWPGVPATATANAQSGFGPLPERYGEVADVRPGAILVASRALGDPNFVQTVILLVHHGEDGAMGLVLNRRTDIPLGAVFESIEGARDHSAPVFSGGPVVPTGAQALVRSSSPVADGRQVVGEVYVLGSALALTRRLSGPVDERRFRVYLGYAGWGPGQLEEEVRRRSWHIVDGEAAIVFDDDPDSLWQRQIRRANVQMASTRPPH